MIVHSLDQFQKALTRIPQSSLILSKEINDKKRALKMILLPHAVRFNRENFNSQAFMNEFESHSFLTKNRMIVVEDFDRLNSSALETLDFALTHPCLNCQLVLIGETAGPKWVEKAELTLKIAPKRPFEKEGDLASFLVERAQKEGVHLGLDVARIWVKSFGNDQELLSQELDKMICYVGEKREITLAAIREFSITLPHHTLWQLGDAIFANSRKEAWQILHTLLEEGSSLFQILVSLRSQFETSIRMLQAHKRGSLLQEFPYLKGGLAQKKIALLSGFGISRLKRALIYLFEVEIKAKSQSIENHLLAEILLIRVTSTNKQIDPLIGKRQRDD